MHRGKILTRSAFCVPIVTGAFLIASLAVAGGLSTGNFKAVHDQIKAEKAVMPAQQESPTQPQYEYAPATETSEIAVPAEDVEVGVTESPSTRAARMGARRVGVPRVGAGLRPMVGARQTSGAQSPKSKIQSGLLEIRSPARR